MEFTFSEKSITFDKELNSLDRLVISFCKKLDKHNVKYCLVSGYVAIVFGRTRETEDVDIITERIPKEKFTGLWTDILTEFECINEDDLNKVHTEFLLNNDSVRFSEPGKPMPNMEIKFEHRLLDKYSLENAFTLFLNKYPLRISPLELQIAYKLYLGSDKDIEDATHLYTIFKNYLNKEKLSSFFVLLKVPRETVKLLD